MRPLASTRLVAPTALPLTLAALKGQAWDLSPARETDQQLVGWLQSAVSYVEHHTRRRLITQTWQAWFDNWDDKLELDGGRVQSVELVEVTLEDGSKRELAESEFVLAVNSSRPGVVAPVAGWPDDLLAAVEPIRVEYVCGFGGADDVPESIKQALLLLVEQWRCQRKSDVIGASVEQISFGAQRLLDGWVLHG